MRAGVGAGSGLSHRQGVGMQNQRSANKSRREVQHAHPKVSLDPVSS
jgi:hypothetical protein